ncbi:MAG: outer membrane beta-barrel protein [Proteobacteria bacterium]|nr:outer membrane beta-barrel protein [Pseudomonadota bacterium]
MNKILTALSLSCAVLACSPLQAAWQGNWLVGASGGYTTDRGELEITMLDNGRQTVTNRRVKDHGWLLGLLGGYQVKCNHWLLGAELNLDWYDLDNDDDGERTLAFTDTSNNGWNAASTYEREWVVGLTGRMGYEIATYLMPYVRAGLEWSDDELSYIQTSNNNVVTAQGDGSQDSLRLIAGIGAEIPFPMVDGLSMRVEYDYHAKGKRVDLDAAAAGNQNPLFVHASRKPYTQTGIISVVWNI